VGRRKKTKKCRLLDWRGPFGKKRCTRRLFLDRRRRRGDEAICARVCVCVCPTDAMLAARFDDDYWCADVWFCPRMATVGRARKRVAVEASHFLEPLPQLARKVSPRARNMLDARWNLCCRQGRRDDDGQDAHVHTRARTVPDDDEHPAQRRAQVTTPIYIFTRRRRCKGRTWPGAASNHSRRCDLLGEDRARCGFKCAWRNRSCLC